MLVVKRNMKSGLKVTISKIILADMGNYQFFVRGFQELLLGWGSSIKYVHKIFRKTNISNPLIRTRTCAYQGVRNVSFSENFACVLN